jgi:hypothetical protein
MIPGIQQLKLGAKVKWVLIELIVVFLGVYFAFVLNNVKESNETKKEQRKVYAALKRELEYFRVYFPGRAAYNEAQVKNFVSKAQNEDSPDFSEWRFTQPQYNYQVLDYAINIRNSDIIDFELYVALQELYGNLQRLENTEKQITATAGKYRSVSHDLNPSSQEYAGRVGDNRIQLRRFLQFMRDRAANLKETANTSEATLTILNERMGFEFRKAIELDLIKEQVKKPEDLEDLQPIINRFFPHLSEEEIKNLLPSENK